MGKIANALGKYDQERKAARLPGLTRADRDALLSYNRKTGHILNDETGSDRVQVSLPEGSCPLDPLTDAVEREVVQKALERHDGNVSQTARYLEVTRQSLIYRLRKHGLR